MFSKRVIPELSDNKLFKLVKEKKISGRIIIDLSMSNPTAAGLKYPAKKILSSTSSPDVLNYIPDPRGLLSARMAVADYYRKNHRIISAEEIYLTSSTSESYSYILKLLCNPGDEVLIPKPGYPLLEPLASLESVKFIPYPLNYHPEKGWSLPVDKISGLISTRTRAIVTVNPNNPTGSYLKKIELAGLNKICGKYNLALIVDEVFSDYTINEAPDIALTASGNKGALTFIMNGLSKYWGLPQLKMGWICLSGPVKLLKEAKTRLDYISDTYLSSSSTAQSAVVTLLKNPNPILNQIIKRIKKNLESLERMLTVSQYIKVLPVQGGWYGVLHVPNRLTDEEMALKLLELDNILIHPGYYYDFPEENYLVVSLIVPCAQFKLGLSGLIKRFG